MFRLYKKKTIRPCKILGLPLHRTFSISGDQDKTVWKFNDNGDYTVSSTYWLLFNEHHEENPSGWKSCFWKRLWSFKLPYKLIIFIWKICSNCLPVRSELHKRVQGISPHCHFCNKEEETIEHLFLLCPMARAIWFGTDLSLKTDGFMVNSLKDWIGDWLFKPYLTQPEALWFYGHFVCTLWCIWLHRSETIFNNQRTDPTKVIFHQKAIF